MSSLREHGSYRLVIIMKCNNFEALHFSSCSDYCRWHDLLGILRTEICQDLSYLGIYSFTCSVSALGCSVMAFSPHSQIFLYSLRHRLPTNDRFSSYSSFRPMTCPLCDSHVETFPHLFFECPYSSYVLSNTLAAGAWTNTPMNWDNLVDYIIQFRGSNLRSDILKLVLSTTVYKIWAVRNSIVHNKINMPMGFLSREIINVIKSRLSSSPIFAKRVQTRPNL